ncbi:MAG: hypothetical protein NTY07_17870 [Bacteroidia bacterium]|nr:hypothetical protein [Bacteroidia bacterium]
MNPTLQSIFLVIQITVFIALLLPTLYIFVFAFAGLFYKQPPYPGQPLLRKIAVLIPGYKEDDVIVDVAKAALNQNYPQDLYDVIIIADSFQPET